MGKSGPGVGGEYEATVLPSPEINFQFHSLSPGSVSLAAFQAGRMGRGFCVLPLHWPGMVRGCFGGVLSSR